MQIVETDILVIGVGAGGFGAIYSALNFSEGKVKVTAIDINSGMGGTSTYAGVCVWEPGIGGPGVHYKLADALLKEKLNACVSKSTNSLSEQVRWGKSEPCDDKYETTLNRSLSRHLGLTRRFTYKADSMDKAMQNLVSNYKNFEFMPNTLFVETECNDGKITSVLVENTKSRTKTRIFPKVVIDATADISVARKSGCSYSIGEDSLDMYNEPSAPLQKSNTINGVTQMFTANPCEESYIQEIPAKYKNINVSEWMEKVRVSNLPVSCFYYYPDNTISVNMLPTMEGNEFLSMDYDKAKEICEARVYHYWRWIQEEKGFRGYKIASFSPMLGVRETYRLIGKYVLNENDVKAGFLNQHLKNELISFSDHALDTHGSTNVKGPRCPELTKPYGIPYSSMIPNEIKNLIVACRGASFSHIAASSARQIKTMLAMGEAAGLACVIANENNTTLDKVDTTLLREKLNITEFEKKMISLWRLNDL